VQVRILKAVTLSLFLVTLEVASVNAQAPSPARTEARSPLSEWFSRVTGTDGNRHQQGSLPARLVTPLPRPRPTELTSVPVAPNTEPLKPTAAPVPSNDEPSELTTATVPPVKEPSELTTSSVPPNREPSELTAAPVAPKKKAPAQVLIND
jgi:hypothetical protein